MLKFKTIYMFNRAYCVYRCADLMIEAYNFGHPDKDGNRWTFSLEYKVKFNGSNILGHATSMRHFKTLEDLTQYINGELLNEEYHLFEVDDHDGTYFIEKYKFDHETRKFKLYNT